MNKADKRQRSIRNKLMAAVAMLLVASIMTVTTTYAWFTLSTAPEVQGITTTVGANGNLEIALSPVDGDYSKITSEIGDANAGWTVKNLTWGNLLDLSDASYRLDELTLLPSRLNITAGTETTAATLSGSPLKVPVYGSDGRISALDGDKITTGTYQMLENGVTGFMSNRNFGIRAVGTSSTMSPDLIAYNSALSALSSGSTRANSTVTTALNTYGAVLADMAVKHASVGAGEDTNDYAEYVDELRSISDALVSAADDVEEALYNVLLALTKSKAGEQIKVEGQDAYTYIKTQMDNGTPLKALWQASGVSTLLDATTFTAVIKDAYDTWADLDDDVQTNRSKVNALDATQSVSWTQISAAVSVMLDTGKITISGYPVDKVIDNIVSIMGTAGGVRLELGEGTGVIADFGELTGDILSSVTLSNGLSATVGSNTVQLGGLPVKIVTTSEPDGGALLTQCRTLIVALGVGDFGAGENDTATLIDVIYAYMIDFAFRTNAANSSLLLQTDAAQRIYGDSTSLSTMGGGSTITFSDTFLNLDSLVSMMSGIRVVFTDTKGNEVYGVAKVHFDEYLMKLNLMSVERTLEADDEETTDENGVTTVVYGKKIEYTEGAATPTNVLLSADNEGNVTLNVQLGTDADNGALYLGNHQYLVRETLTEEDAAGVESTYERWTVKTAVTYTVSETVTTKTPTGTDADGKTTYTETPGTALPVTYELTDGKGNVIFYDHKDIDGDGDDDYYLNADAAAAAEVITGKVGETNTTENDGRDTVNVYYTDLAALITAAGTTVAGEYPAEADANGVFTKVDKVYKAAADYATDIQTGHDHAEPKYFHVDDQAVSLEGPLHMFDYSVDDKGELLFTTPLNEQTITTLDQNVPTGITAMVYLDGDYVDNSDVSNSADGISNSGALNLQFASSANLVPMENTDLKNSKDYEVKFSNNAGATMMAPKNYVTEGQDFLFALNQEYTVTYTVKEGDTISAPKPLTGTQQNVMGVNGWLYTVPGADIKGEVSITIEPKA